MAKAQILTPPPPEVTYVLEMTYAEAKIVYQLLGQVAGNSHANDLCGAMHAWNMEYDLLLTLDDDCIYIMEEEKANV